MIVLYVFILMTWGISNILVNESVFRKQVEWLKNKNKFLNKVLSCSTCLSFYIGIIVGLLLGFNITSILFIDIIIYGFIGSGSVNIIEMIKTKFI